MINKKNKTEIEELRRGGKVLATIMNDLCAMVSPGVYTGDLEKEANCLLTKVGGRSAQKNFVMPDKRVFPTALITCVNDEIVHAPSLPSRRLESGDILSIDLVMEYPLTNKLADKNKVVIRNSYSELGGFYTDMSRTVPVGKIGSEVKKLLRVTKECLSLAIKEVKPGANLRDIGSTIQSHAEAKGFSVIRDLVGHGVGYSLHEDPLVPNYSFGSEIQNIVLEPGMVLAIEPMIAMGDYHIRELSDGFSYATKDGSLCAHFEHSVAVSDSGHIILTKIK